MNTEFEVVGSVIRRLLMNDRSWFSGGPRNLLILYRGRCQVLVYSLFDRKLGEYGALVLARNDDSIRRSVLDGVRGTGSLVELHPEDFDLVHVGEFDNEHGSLEGANTRFVANVAQILKPEVSVANG